MGRAASLVLILGMLMLVSAGGMTNGSSRMVDLRAWDLAGRLLLSTHPVDAASFGPPETDTQDFVNLDKFLPYSISLGLETLFLQPGLGHEADVAWLQEKLWKSSRFTDVYPTVLSFSETRTLPRWLGPYPIETRLNASDVDDGTIKLSKVPDSAFYSVTREGTEYVLRVEQFGTVSVNRINVPLTLFRDGEDAYSARIDVAVGDLIPSRACKVLGFPSGLYRVAEVHEDVLVVEKADFPLPQLLDRSIVVEVTVVK